MLDEPTSALDPVSTSKIEAQLTELKKKYTIILVPHNIQQAARMADYAAFFLMGEIIEYRTWNGYVPKPKRQTHAGLHHRKIWIKKIPCLRRRFLDSFPILDQFLRHERAVANRLVTGAAAQVFIEGIFQFHLAGVGIGLE